MFFQCGLRTRVRVFLGWYFSTMYGPDEIGWASYPTPESLALGTGANWVAVARKGKSPSGLLSLKTIVFSSGVSIDLMPSGCLYGPW